MKDHRVLLPPPRSGSWSQILLMPLLVSFVGLLLLWAVSFIPTERIQDHALAAAYQLNDEGWPRYYTTSVGHTEFARGNTNDSISVMTAYTLDRQHPSNLLLKKINSNPNLFGWYRRLIETVEVGETVTESYSRYWMGFRAPIRLMLVFTAYYGMRILATGVAFLLLVVAASTTAKRSSTWVAIALSLTIALIEPWALAGTLSYITCLILLLLLIVCLNCAKLELSDGKSFLLFCLFGALTQYFDFYTFPLLVCALPLLVLLARYDGERPMHHAARLCGGWLSSWIVTWLINMILVSLFTEDNGIGDALSSAAYRLGVSGFRDASTSYSIPEAFQTVWEYLKLPPAKLLIPALLAAMLILFLVSRRVNGKNNRRLGAYLAVGSLGLIWIAVTAQPIIKHVSMQYRNICVVYFALMLYALEALGILRGKNKLAAKLWKK